MFHAFVFFALLLTVPHVWLTALPLIGMAAGVFTHSITTGYKSDEGTITSVIKSFTGDAELGVEDNLAVGATNQHYTLAITISQIKAMVLYASGSVTIKTNSSSTPQETISLGAGAQLVWTNDASLGAIPFAGNITGFYVTNTDVKIANFKARFLLTV